MSVDVPSSNSSSYSLTGPQFNVTQIGTLICCAPRFEEVTIFLLNFISITTAEAQIQCLYTLCAT